MSDYARVPLGTLLRRRPSYGINAAAVSLRPGMSTYLRITDIDSDGRFAPSPAMGVDHTNAIAYRMNEGELVFARTGASVGKSYLYRPTDGELIYAGFLINVAPDQDRLDPRYLAFYAQTSEYWDWVARTSVRSGQPGVNGREFATLRVPLPDLTTQKRIADVLDDADNLLESLERLTAKKRAIRQGLLQELLAGRTRLPGFGGEWRRVRLGDEGGTFGGLTGKTKDDFGAGRGRYVTFVEVMSGERLFGRRLERVKLREGERQNEIRRDDVLFNGSSETPGEVALATVVDFTPEPSTFLNSFCFGYRLKSRHQIDPTYLAYFFRSAAGRELVSALAQGATRYNIAKTKLMRVTPLLPPVDEQRAVVGVLRDVESELDALERRITKAREMKRGMMQQLLTGRVRLPAEAAA